MRRLSILSLIAILLAACSSAPTTTTGADPQAPTPGVSESPTDSPIPNEGEGGTTAGEEDPADEDEGSASVELWYAIPTDTSDGAGIFPVHRDIPAVPGIGAATLELWIEGPSAAEKKAGIRSMIPSGTELLGLTIDDGTAIVDLSSEFERTGTGSFGESMLLAELAYTITQFPTVDEALLKIDGEFKDYYMSHGFVIDEEHPLKRRRNAPVAPITVDDPNFGDEFSSGDAVSGTANVFEANVSLRLRGEDGKVLFEGFTTATCGTGCRGDFSEPFVFDIDHEQSGTIEVYESSAKDGSEINMVRISVRLVP